ncbi:hypothetical protein R6Q59_023677, partial [Mikania micrantha]
VFAGVYDSQIQKIIRLGCLTAKMPMSNYVDLVLNRVFRVIVDTRTEPKLSIFAGPN